MDERTLRLLILRHVPGFGNHRIASLVRVGGVDALLESPRAYLDRLGEEAVVALESGAARRQAEAVRERAARAGQRLLALGAADYPPALAAIYDPPPVLFLRGTLDETRRRVGIVGSRGATPSARGSVRSASAAPA